jgi:hypothetical protein
LISLLWCFYFFRLIFCAIFCLYLFICFCANSLNSNANRRRMIPTKERHNTFLFYIFLFYRMKCIIIHTLSRPTELWFWFWYSCIFDNYTQSIIS